MTSTFGVLTTQQRTFYEMQLLDRATPNFLHLAFGQRGVSPITALPEHAGATIDWRILNSFTAVTTALTEGSTPASMDMSMSNLTATVDEYGAYIRYTKKLAMMGIDRVAVEAADALGEQAGDSLDQLVRNVIIAGTTIQYASTAAANSDITSAMKLTALELLEAVATLKVNKARPLDGGKFSVIIHPYTEYDLYNDSTFQTILKYSQERGKSNSYFTGYMGEAVGCELFVSPNAYELPDVGSGGTVDVFYSVVIGKGAFGIGGLAQYMPSGMQAPSTNSMTNSNTTMLKTRPLRLIQKDFGSAGSADPLDQRASIAWYTTFVTKILQQNFMVVIRHATALGGS
jgi:N4-gp56 family major capsid protein